MFTMLLLGVRSLTALALGSWAASQLFAFQTGYPRSLGPGLHTTYGTVLYAPYAVGVWLWRWPGLIASPQMWQSLLIGLALTGLGLLWTWVNRHQELALSSHGTSRWATTREVKHLGEPS
jgi:hypothetical protein